MPFILLPLADYHVATFKHLDPQAMTYHPRLMQDWASCTAE